MTLGERLASVGLAEDAVAAFLRGQDVKAAIDCCVLLNQVLSLKKYQKTKKISKKNILKNILSPQPGALTQLTCFTRTKVQVLTSC